MMATKEFFNKMNNIGRKGEEVVMNLLMSKGDKPVYVGDRCLRHDIELISFGYDVLIDVKTVSKAYPRERRYLFLETCQNVNIRSLGWIFDTDAKYIYWVFPNDEETCDIYVYKTDVLRSYIAKGKLKIYDNSCGADTEGFMLKTNAVPCEKVYRDVMF